MKPNGNNNKACVQQSSHIYKAAEDVQKLEEFLIRKNNHSLFGWKMADAYENSYVIFSTENKFLDTYSGPVNVSYTILCDEPSTHIPQITVILISIIGTIGLIVVIRKIYLKRYLKVSYLFHSIL